ncbi:hypothetical protein AVEN_131495-1 [Araneus ventricosus]|uniref:CRAL/TRIO N-terminal domain-containing protein n=1 Tax=Araneus ventricosus TaxID=182803 RepID=A0A4Y2W5D1_ARAVE|nr:hypothetical protein AVEN_131495-1 [Araneus ventricosus]
MGWSEAAGSLRGGSVREMLVGVQSSLANHNISLRPREALQVKEKSKGFCPLQDDEFLLRFLRGRKYDVSRAFTTLKNYYMFKSEYSGVITDLTPTDLKRVLELEHVFVSPKRAPGGEGLLIVFLESSSDMDEEQDETGHSIADAKAATNVLNNFFATENIYEHVVCLFKIVDKQID